MGALRHDALRVPAGTPGPTRSVLSSEQWNHPLPPNVVPLVLLPIYTEPAGAAGPIGSNKPGITRIRPDGGRTRGECECHHHDDPTAAQARQHSHLQSGNAAKRP